MGRVPERKRNLEAGGAESRRMGSSRVGEARKSVKEASELWVGCPMGTIYAPSGGNTRVPSAGCVLTKALPGALDIKAVTACTQLAGE